jgi:rhodanese-related sulfurtransferase
MAEGALGIHGGNRSPIAVSALRRIGFQAANIPAGFAGHPSAVSAG